MSTTGAGVHESFPIPGGRIQKDTISNLNVPSLDPQYFKDPKTAATGITSVLPTPDLLCLKCTLPGSVAKGTVTVFTAPAGTGWRIVDAVCKVTGSETGGTTQLVTSTGAVHTAMTAAAAGAVVRPTAGWSEANAAIAAGEVAKITTASSGTNQAAQVVEIFLARTT